MAIAFDASAGNHSSSTSVTATPSVGSGANRLLWASGFFAGGLNQTGLTAKRGGSDTALTHVSGSPMSIGGSFQFLAYLTNPDSGSNDVIASYDAGGNLTLHVGTFTGCSQTGIPANVGTSDIGTSGAPSQSLSVGADDFAVWALRGESGDSVTPGTNTSLANEYAPFDERLFYSTAALGSAGTMTLSGTCPSSHHYGIMASFSPVATSFTRNMSDTVSNAASRAKTLAKGYTRDLADSASNAVSRVKTVIRLYMPVRTPTATVSVAASRASTVSRALAAIRAASATVSNAASRAKSLSKTQTLVRALSDSASNAASRGKTVLAYINGFLLTQWRKKAKPTGDSWTRKSKPSP